MSFELSAILASWVLIFLLALVVAGLVRQVHILNKTVANWSTTSGPRVGVPAPLLDNELQAKGSPAVMLFADAGCASCTKVLPDFTRLAEASAGQARFLAVFSGEAELSATTNLHVLTDQRELHTRFGVPATPFAVSLSEDGIVLDAAPVGSSELLRQFVEKWHRRWGNGTQN